MGLLKSRSGKYEQFLAEKRANANWENSLLATIGNAENEVNLTEKQLESAESTAKNVSKARQLAAKEIFDEEKVLGHAKVDFTRGVETWKTDEIIKSSLDIALAVGDLVSQVPAIAASGGTLAVLPVASMVGDMIGMTLDGAKRISSSQDTDDDDVLDLSWLFGDDEDDDFVVVDGTADDVVDSFTFISRTPETEASKAFLEKYKQDVAFAKEDQEQRKKDIAKVKDGGKALLAAGKDAKAVYDGVMKIMDTIATAKKLEEQSEKTLLKAAAGIADLFGVFKYPQFALNVAFFVRHGNFLHP